MVRTVRKDGEIFKVPFSMKEVPGSLTGEALCSELANELSQIKPVRNNATETVPMKLQQCQKKNYQNHNTKRSMLFQRLLLLLYQYITVRLSSFRLPFNIHFLKPHCHFKTQCAIAILFINCFKYHCRQELFTF